MMDLDQETHKGRIVDQQKHEGQCVTSKIYTKYVF